MHQNLIKVEYNERSLLTKQTDALGNTFEYQYDANGTIAYSYDSYGRLSSKATYDYGTLTYTYNESNDISSITTSVNNIIKGTTSYEYDLMDRIVRVVGYDGSATLYEYDAIGNRTKVRHEGGLSVEYQYDSCSRLINEIVTDTDGRILMYYGYTYGTAGEKTSAIEVIRESAEDTSARVIKTEYVYDYLLRLVSETINVADDVSNTTDSDNTQEGKTMKKLYKTTLCLAVTLACGLALISCGKTSGQADDKANNTNKTSDYDKLKENNEAVESDELDGGLDEDENIEKNIYDVCTETEGDELLFNPDEEINVLFVGNSLLGEPKVCQSFARLAEKYGRKVKVEYEVFNGMSVSAINRMIKAPEYDFIVEEYKNADVIIFQEYGGYYDTTYEDIREAVDEYCKEDVIVYYYTSEFDYYSDHIEKMSKDKSIHIIDAGEMIASTDMMLIGEEYDIEYLHKKGDYHPNVLSGVLTAAYVYTQMYKCDITEFTYDELEEAVKVLIPGDTDEVKRSSFDKMIENVNKGVL